MGQRPAGTIHPGYSGFFDCFNSGRYYEAHDVLEALWLERRGQPEAGFQQGLIQLAGAFVHFQKHTDVRPRLVPAASLLRAAARRLGAYPPGFGGLDTAVVLDLIRGWQEALAGAGPAENPFHHRPPPQLPLPQVDAGLGPWALGRADGGGDGGTAAGGILG